MRRYAARAMGAATVTAGILPAVTVASPSLHTTLLHELMSGNTGDGYDDQFSVFPSFPLT